MVPCIFTMNWWWQHQFIYMMHGTILSPIWFLIFLSTEHAACKHLKLKRILLIILIDILPDLIATQHICTETPPIVWDKCTVAGQNQQNDLCPVWSVLTLTLTPGISRCRSQNVSVESSSLLHHSIYLWFICFPWWSIDELEYLHADRTTVCCEPWLKLRARLSTRKTGLSPPDFFYWPFQGGASAVAYIYFLSHL